ncbi:MAG: hypothetical protein HRU41_39165 [Saprospiraceae bacterium]|nr:hypothetical protein [Saprospiraceae bacterium]
MTPIRYFVSLTFILLITPLSTWSQPEGDFTKDLSYFQAQAQVYQDWLDRSGFGAILEVHDLEVKPQEVALYLRTPFQDVDSIMNAWNLLKETYEADAALSLEEHLFYKMIHLMEIDQTKGNVQLYNTYDLNQEPVFFRGIYFENDQVKVAEDNPRSKIRDIAFDKEDIRIPRAKENINGSYNSNAVFDLIYRYAEAKYQNRDCPDRKPVIEKLEKNKRVLRFEVYNLCQEVIQGQGFICPMLRKMGLNCNFAKRELLRFTITYTETPSGFQLQLILDGKFGSALFEKASRRGYISMEEDFDDELDRYADIFVQELGEQITGN